MSYTGVIVLNKYIQYVDVNDIKFYNFRDICEVFKLSYDRLKVQLSNKFITLKKVDSEEYEIFIDDKMILELSHICRSNKFNRFAVSVIRNAFGEEQYDRGNHRIILHQIDTVIKFRSLEHDTVINLSNFCDAFNINIKLENVQSVLDNNIMKIKNADDGKIEDYIDVDTMVKISQLPQLVNNTNLQNFVNTIKTKSEFPTHKWYDFNKRYFILQYLNM